jgi:hypothetical protein
LTVEAVENHYGKNSYKAVRLEAYNGVCPSQLAERGSVLEAVRKCVYVDYMYVYMHVDIGVCVGCIYVCMHVKHFFFELIEESKYP